MIKPLGRKSYGSIPHLPGSRLGPADHTCHAGQARIATEQARDKHDFIVVQEKIDGSNVGIARIGGDIFPLTRAGYLANTSPFEQHHIFYHWALERRSLFLSILNDGERLCGEWMVQAHGTVYHHLPGPLITFDIIQDDERLPFWEFDARIRKEPDIFSAHPIFQGGPTSIKEAMMFLGDAGFYGAEGGPEGAVWRVHRHNKVDFLVKFVRPDKQDGKYLGETDPVWHFPELRREGEHGGYTAAR